MVAPDNVAEVVEELKPVIANCRLCGIKRRFYQKVTGYCMDIIHQDHINHHCGRFSLLSS